MKIYINTDYLRIRKRPSLSADVVGFADKGTYLYKDTTTADGYKWYQIDNEMWVAGVDGVEEVSDWVAPTPVKKNSKKDQVYIGDFILRIRSSYSTSSEKMGVCEKNSYYNVLETRSDQNYTWYKLGDQSWIAGVEEVEYYPVSSWVEPVPVQELKDKNQVYVGDYLLNIRKLPNTSSEKMGVCKTESFYDVLELVNGSDYTWYKIGDQAYLAGISDLEYYPIGTTRKVLELKDEIKRMKNSLSLVELCIDKGLSRDNYDALYSNLVVIREWIDNNFDPIEYDYSTNKEYDEIDILNTTDVHGSWYDYDMKGCYNTPVFSYNDVGKYRDKLEKQGIKTFIVDCGDWSRPGRTESNEANDAVKAMTTNGFIASTYGNHEWKWMWGEGASKSIEILNKLKCITACNIFKNGKEVFKPYRALKVGSKKIGIIGVGYPSPNGFGDTSGNKIWSYDGYEFYDGQRLYDLVQKHIDMFKSYKFDYIFVICHLDKETEESLPSDTRCIARSDLLVQNTSGLTGVFQGHYNYRLNPQVVLDKSGNKVLIAYDAGSNLDCFGRLRIKKDGTLTSTLITSRSKL